MSGPTGTLSYIIDNSAFTSVDKWGFVILRGVYDNDDVWQTFLALFEAAVIDELDHFKLEERLSQHLDWTVIEDRATLDGVSKAVVRARFLTWVEEQKRVGEIADKPWAADHLTRYKYCLYVDDTCIRSMSACLRERESGVPQWCLSDSWVVIVNGLHQEYTQLKEGDPDYDDLAEDDGDEGYRPVEGSTNYDVGWAYIDISYAETYAQLGSGGVVWDGMVYRGRRPDIEPKPNFDSTAHSLSKVDRSLPGLRKTAKEEGSPVRTPCILNSSSEGDS